jgi:hypothetical protein
MLEPVIEPCYHLKFGSELVTISFLVGGRRPCHAVVGAGAWSGWSIANIPSKVCNKHLEATLFDLILVIDPSLRPLLHFPSR